MTAPDDVRARFEAWVQRNGPQYMERDRHNGDYLSPCLEATWRGYRAAHADLSGEVRELVGEAVMGEKMTLHDRVEFALRDAGLDLDEASRIATLADDPHITQPAQSVDVEKVREVIAEMRAKGEAADVTVEDWADKLTAAL